MAINRLHFCGSAASNWTIKFMAHYHICSLDSGGFKITNHLRDCADDVEASAVARETIVAGGLAEVWAGARMIATVSMPYIGGQ